MSYEKLSSPPVSFTMLPKSEEEQVTMATGAVVDAEKMANLGLLLAGLAHEINNPASFVHNSALNLQHRMEHFQEFLLSLSEEGDSEFHALLQEKLSPMIASIDTLIHGVERILDIVSNVQMFQRQQSSVVSPTLDTIGEGLRKTIALVQPTYKNEVNFVCTILDDPPISAWHLQLNQVFLNLAVNACQAIHQKKMALELGDDFQGLLEVSTTIVGKQLHVVFKDNGLGVETTMMERIFEPYFSTKSPGEGTGLGLTISYEIVERHKGSMEVESTRGKGTCFTVKLPLPV